MKKVQLAQNWFRTPTWPPFHCFGTPIWLPYHHNHNRNNGGDNFPHLPPMAELQRNQRGDIGRQHVKAHYAAASVHV